MSIFEGIDPADMPMLMERINDCITNLNNLHAELRFHCPDGKVLWMMLSVRPTVYDHYIYADGVIFDITARKEAEQALNAERLRLQTLGDNLPSGCLYQFMYSTATGYAGFTYLSRAWERITGITVEEAMNNLDILTERMHPDDRPVYAGAFAKSLAGMEPFTAEMRFMLPTGRMRWGRLSSMPHLEGTDVVWDGFLIDITAQKEADLELTAEKERLETIGNNMPDGALYRSRINLQTGAIWLEYLSATWEKISGVSVEDALKDIGSVFARMEPGYLEEMVRLSLQSTVDLKPFTIEFGYHHPLDGKVHRMKISSVPVADGDSFYADGTLFDITERYEAEQNLIFEKERLQSLGDNLPNGVLFRFQIEASALSASANWLQHLKLGYASASWESLSNVPLADVMADISLPFMKIHPDDMAAIYPAMYESLCKLTAFNAEVCYMYAADDMRWLQISSLPRKEGNLIVTDGFIIDITVRKEAEQALIAEKERLETIGDNVPDGALFRFRMDLRDNRMSLDYVSGTCEKVTGVSAEQALANISSFFANADPDDRPALTECIRESVSDLKRFNIEVRYHHPVSRKMHWFQITAQPRREGNIVYSDGLIIDVTERHEAAAELELYRRELERLVVERTAELKASNEELESTGEELYATNEELYTTNAELNDKNRQLSEEVAARMEVMRRLEDSESKVRNFIRRSFEGILMMDNEGRIVEWNEAMTRITGIAHDEALGKYNWDLLREFLPKREEANSDALYERIRREEMEYIAGGPDRKPLLKDDELYMPDGTVRFLQTSVFPIALTDTCYFGKILRDITEQKQTHMELERYRTQLEEMVEAKSRDLLATHASLEATNCRQALFIKVLQMLQMEPDVPAAMNMALAELGAYTGVDRLATWENHPDGVNYGCTYEWCNTGVEPAIQYLGSMTIEAGKPWFDMLTKDDYICTSDMATLHPYIQGMLRQQGVQSIAVFPMSILGTQFGFLSFNFFHAKEWDMRDVELMAQMAQIMGTATRRWQAEAELIRAKEKAEESDRLKSAFLANVSHEIRTPLNGIIGFLQFLSSDSLPPARRREYTRIVNSNGTQLVKLIDDIVDISKIEARQMKMHPAPVPVNTLMAEIYTFFDAYIRNAGKTHVALVLDESGSVSGCVALIDPTRLRQVLNNLIGNAVKFTEKGYIRFGYRQPAPDLLEFTVEDTGIGIPPAMHEIIFERFRQAETENGNDSISRIYGGTGLGLAISRSLVQLMGGEMRVESTEGNGATFGFTVEYVKG
jgi:PAS domain S-box-containing protein